MPFALVLCICAVAYKWIISSTYVMIIGEHDVCTQHRLKLRYNTLQGTLLRATGVHLRREWPFYFGPSPNVLVPMSLDGGLYKVETG